MKEFLKTLGGGLFKTIKDTGSFLLKAYVSLLKHFFLFSALYLIAATLILFKFNESPGLNAAVVLIAGILAIGWLILLIPIASLTEYIPARIRYSLREKGQKIMGIANMALATAVYFSIVDVSKNPPMVFPIILLWIGLTINYIRRGVSVDPGKIERKIIVAMAIVTIHFYNPDFQKDLGKFVVGTLETLNKEMETARAPLWQSPETQIAEQKPVAPETQPNKQQQYVQDEMDEEQIAPQLGTEEKHEAQPPPSPPEPLMLAIQTPRDLREFRQSYQQMEWSRHYDYGDYETRIDVLHVNEEAALTALEMELSKAMSEWGKSHDIKVVESAKNLAEMEEELRIGRDRVQNPLDYAETADLFMVSSIGFRSQETNRKTIGRNLQDTIDRFLPYSARRYSRTFDNSGYEEITISVEVVVATYIYNRDRVVRASSDGRGFTELKVKYYNIGGIYEKSSSNEKFLLAAIQEAVKEAISKIEF